MGHIPKQKDLGQATAEHMRKSKVPELGRLNQSSGGGSGGCAAAFFVGTLTIGTDINHGDVIPLGVYDDQPYYQGNRNASNDSWNSSGVITVPTSGFYHLAFSAFISSTGVDVECVTNKGSAKEQIPTAGANTMFGPSPEASYLWGMEAGDDVCLHVLGGDGGKVYSAELIVAALG